MASLEQIISFVKGDKTSISHPLKVLLFEMINVTLGLCVYTAFIGTLLLSIHVLRRAHLFPRIQCIHQLLKRKFGQL